MSFSRNSLPAQVSHSNQLALQVKYNEVMIYNIMLEGDFV